MQVKIADQDEIKQVFQEVHCVWPHATDPVEHLSLRLASVQHQRATWFVGLVEGKMVTSLGAYPYQLFQGKFTQAKARVFGAVFTPEVERGKGYARTLLSEVMSFYEQQGVHDFLLFSDIGTTYYQSLGFAPLPSYEWCLPVSSDPLASTPHGKALLTLPNPGFEGFYNGFARDAEFASWLVRKQKGDLSIWCPEGLTIDGQPAYLWSLLENGSYILLESNLSQEPESWSFFVELVLEDARRRGAHAARGWWTAAAAEPWREQSEILPRDKEILMWRQTGTNSRPNTGFRAYLSEHV